MNRILVPLVTATFLLSVLLLADKGVFGCAIRNVLGEEPFKILLQFLLVTVLGGAAFFLLNIAKDNENLRRARILDLQKLDEELSEAYRMTKSSRRRFRSRVLRLEDGTARMACKEFETSMDEVLKAQLAVEAVQDSIATRRQLLGKNDREWLDVTLHYAVRYLHDVYQDFEKGKIERCDDYYSIGQENVLIRDFIEDNELPRDIYCLRRVLQDRTKAQAEKFEALNEIERRRDRDRHQRFAKIAYSSFRLASAEMKRLVDAELHRPASLQDRILNPTPTPQR